MALVRTWRTTRSLGPYLLGALLVASVCLGVIALSTGPEMMSSNDGRPPTNRRHVGLLSLVCATGLAYAFAASILNRTHVTADREGLRVRHRPLPWPGRHTFPASDVLQLYGEEVPLQSGSSRHRVLVLVKNRKTPIQLVGGLQSPGEALFVERKVEHALGIADRPIEGEMPFKKMAR
ncbi:MAG TPA: hypothetical protein VL400_15130 [Polyangiaceae bacterium]|nr:hypothetical protein [Polyangiaceae bacterium]